ncbi:hypothetical protein F4819DRAFT_135417 [Hypoxylon fuscum]|nr:hypothetical protein F4819DRAFT_135417 [Hypoxylon fuscum]
MALTLIATQVAVVLLVIASLAYISLGLRIWSRRIMNIPLAFNDYMAILAMLLTTGTIANSLAEVFTGGIGVHVQDLKATDPWVLDFYSKSFVAAQIIWAAANSAVKISILSLYTVLFPRRKFCQYCYGIMLVILAYFTSVLVEAFALCHPVQYNWDKNIPGGNCGGQSGAYLAAGITNLVIDTCILVLPMPMLFSLHLTLPKKFAVAAMFSLGAVICVVSLLRILWLNSWDLTDINYGVGSGTIYSGLEPTLGVVNACLPTITPALIRLFGTGLLGRTKRGLSSTGNSGQARSQDRRLPPRETHTYGFERLDDDFPLTRIHADNTSSGNLDDHQITITREWEVSNFTQKGNGPTPSSSVV